MTATHTNWPGMTNKALASVLDRLAERVAAGRLPTDYQLSAIEEAAERLRENQESDQ